MIRALALGLALACGLALSAAAHKASDSYLELEVDGTGIAGQWDIALRDLERAIGLDADGNGAVTWGELRARHAAIADYVLARLQLAAGGLTCPLRPLGQLVDRHSDGAYAVLRFAAECAAPPRQLTIDYRLLFDLDPLHRGLVRLVDGEAVQAVVLSPEAPRRTLHTNARPDRLGQLVSFGRQGVWHIWLGFDHILFLVALLLPAVLHRQGGRWEPAGSFGAALAEVVKVVSAFTLAHSLTLTLATLGLIALPSRLVESAVAASVVLAALNNVWPLVQRRLWLLAFGFGLVHGLGFAGVLLDLGLPRHALVIPLLAFNLGVEMGQLVIVALFLPLAFMLRATAVYPKVMVRAGSTAIAALAGVWLLERLFDLRFL